MSLLKKVYAKSPTFLKYIFLNVKAFQNYNQRYGEEFENYFQKYCQLWTAPLMDVKSYQKSMLVNILKESVTYSTYYREIFDSMSFTIEDIEKNPYHVLEKFPVLNKKTRKESVDNILNKNPKRKTIGIGFTSGTSGSPTINYVDKESIVSSFALWKRFHHSLGFTKIHPKTVRFSGNLIIPVKQKRGPFWLQNYFENQLYMSTYHMTEVNIQEYINKLNTYKPELIDGYPSAIFTLAQYILEKNIKLDFIPKAIATTSETLYTEQREKIEKAFSCNVYNQYASSEGSPFITECVKGNLHLNLDSGFFELLDENYEEAKSGTIAKLVVTSLRNFKTPLIRYDIEDSVLIPKEKMECSCGCRMPIVKKIMGREDDLLLANNGSYVGMSAYKIFKYAENIKKGQIIQCSHYEFILNIEASESFSQRDKEFLILKVKESFGDLSKVTVNLVSTIPLGAQGKFKAVIREKF